MASHMKTTVQIPDSLFQEARNVAQREGVTLKVLIEEGLREAIARRNKRGGFRLRNASFNGKGLQAGFQEASWEQIVEASYEEHGG